MDRACSSDQFDRNRASAPDALEALNDQGQATLEYILLLIFVLTFSVGLTRGILASFNVSLLRFNGALEKDLKTGKTPLEAFKNET